MSTMRTSTPPRSMIGWQTAFGSVFFGGANQRICIGVPSMFLMARIISQSFCVMSRSSLANTVDPGMFPHWMRTWMPLSCVRVNGRVM